MFEVASYNNESVRNIMKSCRQDKGRGCSWAIWTENLRNQRRELRTEWLRVLERWYRACVSRLTSQVRALATTRYFLSAPLTVSVRSRYTLFIRVLLTQTISLWRRVKKNPALKIKTSVERKEFEILKELQSKWTREQLYC